MKRSRVPSAPRTASRADEARAVPGTPCRDGSPNREFLRKLAVLATLSVALRGIYLANVLSEPLLSQYWILDCKEYLDKASAALQGGLGAETYSSSPLYIWIVALASAAGHGGIVALLALQALLGVATALGIAIVGKRLFGDLAGLAGASLYVLYPGAALLELKLLPSAIGAFLGFAAVAVLSVGRPRSRVRRGVLSGVLLGSASLCKPDLMLFLPIAIAALSWAERDHATRKIRAVAALAVATGALAPISITVAHNYAACGQVVLISSQGGITFYQANNPRAEGTFSIPEGFTGDKASQHEEAVSFAQKQMGHPLGPADVDRFWFARGLDFLASDLSATLRLEVRKLLYWTSSVELASEYTLGVERNLAWAAWLFPVPFGLLLGLALLALAQRPALNLRAGWHLVTFVAANLCATLAFYCASRYRLMAVPALAVLAGAGVQGLWLQQAGCRAVCLRVVVLALWTGISFVPGRSAARFQEAGEWYCLGNQAFRHKQYGDAIHLYERALTTRKRTPDIHFNLAQARAMTGDFAGAVRELERLLQLNPRDDQARALVESYAERARRK
jgi:4-amino-4-deoxy-L-arabinose transferase-like glycosyltransferase